MFTVVDLFITAYYEKMQKNSFPAVEAVVHTWFSALAFEKLPITLIALK